jgi:hypothetical protein
MSSEKCCNRKKGLVVDFGESPASPARTGCLIVAAAITRLGADPRWSVTPQAPGRRSRCTESSSLGAAVPQSMIWSCPIVAPTAVCRRNIGAPHSHGMSHLGTERRCFVTRRRQSYIIRIQSYNIRAVRINLRLIIVMESAARHPSEILAQTAVDGAAPTPLRLIFVRTHGEHGDASGEAEMARGRSRAMRPP